MPIFANNMVVGNKASTTVPKSVPVSNQDNTPETRVNIEGTALVVNGKAKKISKKSAYLMDMLTLDNE